LTSSCDFRPHNSAMITDRQKYTAKITIYGSLSFHFFHFYRWNQFKVIPLASTVCTRNVFPFFGQVGCGLTTRQITLTSFSRNQPVTITWHTASSNVGSKQLVYSSRALRAEYCIAVLWASSSFSTLLTISPQMKFLWACAVSIVVSL